nr:glycoside hydrolase family 2 TIM barrel-domain containing protein [Candidatus Sigynarchaeum springense]
MANTIPRPEYPRPDAARAPDSWTCLNGEWDFEFDPDNKGMRERWYEQPNFSRKITVPFVYQSKMSGIDDQHFIDHVWYARTFSIPKARITNTILLNFGAVDYECDVFVNGSLVGSHYGGSTSFTFDITPYLTEDKAAAQLLVVHVHDLQFDEQLPRGKQSMVERFSGCDYEKVTGIWQTVWLEYVGQPYYLDRSDFYLRAAWSGHVTGFMNIAGVAPNKKSLVVECAIFDGDKQVSKTGYFAMIVPRFEEQRIELDVDPLAIQRWTPRTPKLYEARFRLIDGNSDDETVLDELRCTFAFREVSIEGNKILLNKEPIYLKFALYQGYFPESLWTPPSDDAMKKDLELLLEMGFNGARIHQIVEDPRFLYWADKMGVLLWGEMANSRRFTGRSRELLLHEWPAVVRRDRNHPSIIAWIPINETWGLANKSLPDEQEFARALYRLTKGEDPTRPVNANDGYSLIDGATDLFSVHIYQQPGEIVNNIPEKYPKVKDPADFAWCTKWYMTGGKYHGEPVIISEWGGWGMNLDDPNAKPDQYKCWGYQGILYKTFDEVLNLYERTIKAFVARKAWICGHVYTEFSDQYQEMNGFVTFDRRPKGDLQRLKAINDLLY